MAEGVAAIVLLVGAGAWVAFGVVTLLVLMVAVPFRLVTHREAATNAETAVRSALNGVGGWLRTSAGRLFHSD